MKKMVDTLITTRVALFGLFHVNSLHSNEIALIS